MKIATFNIENLFHRDESLVKHPISQNLKNWITEFESLIMKVTRQEEDYSRMRELSFLLGFNKSALEPYVVMRRRAGLLYIRKPNATPEYKASELSNWNGWIKVNTTPIHETAIQHKARVITEVNPDVLLVQEVEDRQSLVEFNEQFLPEDVRFSNIMVLPGNDYRGQHMAVMTKMNYEILSVWSHVNDSVDGSRIFEKDFHEYKIKAPNGDLSMLLSAHLQERRSEHEKDDSERKRQAQILAERYNYYRSKGFNKIIVAGTFNAPSYCDSLSPLLRETDLIDIKQHSSFNVDLDHRDPSYFRLGAYRRGVNIRQRDYILIPEDLGVEVKDSGLNRKGIWPERINQYGVFSTLQKKIHQASSHPIIWVEY